MQFLKRLKPMTLPQQNSTANTIYVDSDTEEVKVGTGASGSSERVLATTSVPLTIGPLTISSTAVTSTVPYLAPAGSATNVAFGFAGDEHTGLYQFADGRMAVASNGVLSIVLGGSDAYRFSLGNDASFTRLASGVIGPVAGDAYGLASKAWIRTAPTIASGFGTSPSVVASNGTAAFTINVGTGGTAVDGVITLPAATTGWILHIQNLTAQAANRAAVRTVQTASTTTTATIQNQNVATGVATAWAASDVLSIVATAY